MISVSYIYNKKQKQLYLAFMIVRTSLPKGLTKLFCTIATKMSYMLVIDKK